MIEGGRYLIAASVAGDTSSTQKACGIEERPWTALGLHLIIHDALSQTQCSRYFDSAGQPHFETCLSWVYLCRISIPNLATWLLAGSFLKHVTVV